MILHVILKNLETLSFAFSSLVIQICRGSNSYEAEGSSKGVMHKV